MSHAKPALADLAREVADAIRQGRLDDAESLLEELHARDPATQDLLVFPVMIAIQRGRVREALQHIYTLDDDRCPELKALCLNLVGDPLWEGEARALLDHSPHPHVRRAMQQLLGLVPHDEPDFRATRLAA